ncbi:MAG: sulfatase-like hydrolase/transferase, partial [Akkermansiaceae bacterium]
MTRHAFILSLSVLCAFFGQAVAADKPLNILVLYADDWRHDTLGVAGNPVVKTPRLDALASQGMRFTSNCVTTSVCGVSRACLYTGQWMSRNGCTGFSMFTTP